MATSHTARPDYDITLDADQAEQYAGWTADVEADEFPSLYRAPRYTESPMLSRSDWTPLASEDDGPEVRNSSRLQDAERGMFSLALLAVLEILAFIGGENAAGGSVMHRLGHGALAWFIFSALLVAVGKACGNLVFGKNPSLRQVGISRHG